MAESRQSRTPVLAAALVVLLVVAGLVIAQALGQDEDPATITSAKESNAAAPPGECAEPPEPQAEPEQYTDAPAPSLAEDMVWTATLATNCGDIVLELYGDKAPQTVSSFIFLAREDFWSNSPCHRLTTDLIYVLQCGDPTGTGTGGPGYTFELENPPADQTYPRGALAMARTADPNTNGSQFFIVFEESRLPAPGYSIFGRVVEGMEIVDRVAGAGVAGGATDGAPAQPISILDVTVSKAS